MYKSGLLKAHLGVYWKTQRILIIIFFTVLIVNISLQAIIARLIEGSVGALNVLAILPTIVGVLAGMMFAIPIIEVTAIPYLLTLGSRRRDVLLSATLNNLFYSVFVSTSLFILLRIYSAANYDLAPIYMGVFLDGWSSLLLISLLNLFLFLAITSIVFLIGLVFYRWSILWGLGVIFLLLAIPIWYLQEFYQFFIWGGSYFAVFLHLIMIIIIFLSISKAILSKVEIRHYRPRISFLSFVFFIVMVLIFSASFYFGSERLSNDNNIFNDSGRFAYFDQGVNENSFYSEEDQELRLIWRSSLEEGEMILTLKSPTQEIVYAAPGGINELVTIPLTKGKWIYSVAFNNAKEGRYSLRGLIN